MTTIIASNKSELISLISKQMPLPFRVFSWFDPSNYGWTNVHEHIETEGELAKIISSIKLFGVKEGFKSDSYEYINAHKKISYQGTIIDVKYPSLVGHLTIRKLRPIFENIWNEGFTQTYPLKETAILESATLELLTREGFSTFQPLQDLIKDEKGNLLVNNVVLTRYIEGVIPAIDYMNKHPEEIKNILQEAASLCEWANDLGVNIADPWFGNFSVVPAVNDYKKLLLGDFEFVANPRHSPNLKNARALAQLAISGVFSSNLSKEEVVESMIKGYSKIGFLKEELKHIVEYDKKNLSQPLNFARKIYQTSAFGLDQYECLEVKKEFLKQLR